MSSSVTLSAATRSNLLSLQDTADLMATTQNRLSTGKKVNSALDNPVNFFTSQALNSRSSSLTTLLDGISNGIQTIQAANQGITNIQKLTSQLKSTAQQALAASNAFTAKASVSSAVTVTPDATTKSILGGSLTAATATGGTAYASASLGTGSAATPSTSTGTVAVASDAALQALTGGVITLDDGAGNTATYTIDNTSTKTALTTALSSNGFSASFDGSDHLVITRADGTNFTTTGAGAAAATGTGNANGTGGAAGTPGDAFTLTVGGTTVTLNAAASGSAAGTFTDLTTLVSAINSSSVGSASAAAGKVTASAVGGKLVLTGGDTATSFTAGGAAATKLGFANTATSATTTGGLSGKTLTVSVGGATATTITFGSSTGQVSTLDQLNAQLEAANAQATIDSNGNLSITTTNESGAESIQLGGTATTGVGALFTDTTSHTATLGGDGKTARDKLVNDYNNLRTQIDQLAKDSSFNGVNLLNGDTLKVIFNENNTSSLSVKGVALDADTLGLSTVSSTNFQDSDSINKVLGQITSATGLLNSQAATYGSNLSVVQNRQDFTKNLINVLDTGSSNLTTADLNEEAANSQALSTRQSLAISALSLANTAQQGILQLLR